MTVEPNKENIRKWVDALRSGEYKQGVGALQSGDAYCCLGVACVVSGLEPNPHGLYLPHEVAQWLGYGVAPMGNVPIGRSGFVDKLNDAGMPFAEIADLIEAKYLTEVAA